MTLVWILLTLGLAILLFWLHERVVYLMIGIKLWIMSVKNKDKYTKKKLREAAKTSLKATWHG